MKNVFKKSIGLLLAGTMLFSSALGITASAETTAAVTDVKTSEKTYTVKKKTVPLYSSWYEEDDKEHTKTTVYYVNGSDVPYVDLETILDDYLYLRDLNDKADLFKYTYDGDKVKLIIEEYNYTLFEIDFAKDTITFEDYDGFKTYTRFVLDFSSGDFFDENGNPIYFNRSEEFLRIGNEIVFDLGAYNIDLVQYGKKGLIPLQTYSDLFMIPFFSMFYNGSAVFKPLRWADDFFDDNDKLTDLGKKYYNGKTGKFSKSYVRYAYNELCFMLDHFYGNKELHKITSFDEYFKQTGLYSYLRSTNPKKVDEGLFLLAKYVNDGHTFFNFSTFALGKNCLNDLLKKYNVSFEETLYNTLYSEKTNIISKYYSNGRPAYEEIGDTAFISFDVFSYDFGKNYYDSMPDAKSTDTVGIIGYSFSRILRKNSPIKRVVLDLSCNMGGDDPAATYVLAAFLGKYNLYRSSVLTGTQEIMSIEADTNFDGVFDEKDSLAGNGIKMYCLISEGCFSNGNKVPAMLKNSGLVTLIGRKTSGGAFNVCGMSTAYGSSLKISSCWTDSVMINGTFYNIDAGVDPHIYVDNIENLYNRKALIEYLDNLF